MTDTANTLDLDAIRAENLHLREQLGVAQPVLTAAHAWAEALETDGSAPDLASKLVDLHDAVEQHRVMEQALAAGRRERAEQQATDPCDCCYVDGHTRRCGRTADTDSDIAPFGYLGLAQECKDRINGTTTPTAATSKENR